MTSSIREPVSVPAPPNQRERRSGVGLLAALQFLTILPPLVRRSFSPEELGRSVGWFPLIGLLLGGALTGANCLLGWAFPPLVTSALVLVIWVLSTGALHLDGFLDSCDGLFGGQTPEDRLRIMRDERAGAFAVIGGILLLLLKYTALAGNPDRFAALLLAPVLSRWGMAMAIVRFPYGRPKGLGRSMKDHARWPQALIATLIAATVMVGVALLGIGGWQALLAMPLALGLTWTLARFALRRLPGLTGDVYGAFCELLETAILVLFAAGGSHAA